MKTERTRRRFAHAWDEIGYLRMKILDWFYGRRNASRARPFAVRLSKLLKKADSKQKCILGQECRSLICELRGDVEGAIRHRENEIAMIPKLHKIMANHPDRDYVCYGYEYDDLSDRLDLLALLYDQAGNTRKAIRILEESKALCRKHGIPFDGQDILDELMADPDMTPTRNGRGQRREKAG